MNIAGLKFLRRETTHTSPDLVIFPYNGKNNIDFYSLYKGAKYGVSIWGRYTDMKLTHGHDGIYGRKLPVRHKQPVEKILESIDEMSSELTRIEIPPEEQLFATDCTYTLEAGKVTEGHAVKLGNKWIIELFDLKTLDLDAKRRSADRFNPKLRLTYEDIGSCLVLKEHFEKGSCYFPNKLRLQILNDLRFRLLPDFFLEFFITHDNRLIYYDGHIVSTEFKDLLLV